MKPPKSKGWDKMTTEERAEYAANKTAEECRAQGKLLKLTAAQHRAVAGILASAETGSRAPGALSVGHRFMSGPAARRT
jgi:hypothetical protein